MSPNNLSFNFNQNIYPPFPKKILSQIIVDRGSKYTAVYWLVTSKEEVKQFLKELLTDKYFQKSTHNSYAWRIDTGSGTILESRNDDGETGAGQCILRELRRKNAINTILVVTRYFGGIKLQTDRFKNVIKASKIALKEF